MKKIIILMIGIILCPFLISSYTPPDYNDVNLVLTTGYTPPNYNNINLVLGNVTVTPCFYDTDTLISNDIITCDIFVINNSAKVTLLNSILYFNDTNINKGELILINLTMG